MKIKHILCLVLTVLFANQASAIAIEGTTSGIFTNPVGGSNMVTTGAGTNNFSWGNGIGGPASSTVFAGNNFETNTETFFDLGTITYYNGTITNGTGANSVDLEILMEFTQPNLFTEDFSFLLSLINTNNTSDPVASADIIAFSAASTETIFLNGLAHTLELEVGVVDGSGFTTQNTFSVIEGQSATANIRGILTVNVSEPSALILLLFGLLPLALRKKLM